MIAPQGDGRKAPSRVLVALASYGRSNDQHLERLIQEYRTMPFESNIIVVSNIDKSSTLGVECRVGLPNRNPWSLPFAHKQLFVEHADEYDLFIYSEDDILITEANLRAFLSVTAALREDEVAGFLRMEKDGNGEVSYPDIHAHFHWDATSVRSRGLYTLAHFTNEHAACYVLTQGQLKTAIQSGGFAVDPHEKKYDLLCTAATDPYTQCGLKKFIPVSHIDDFTVHHLSNRYAGRVGVSASELRSQIKTLIRISQSGERSHTLINTETRLPGCVFSKDYYEPVSEDVVSAIPTTARSVLSIGCGWGATEKILISRGLQVVAVPLDPVISSRIAARGVKMIYGRIDEIGTLTRGMKFDCVLCLNVLHLAHDPAAVLSLLRTCLSEDARVIIQTPSMTSLRTIQWALRNILNLGTNYSSTGAHFSSIRAVRKWCSRSGMVVDQTTEVLDRNEDSTLGRITSAIGELLPAPLAFSLATSIVISARDSQPGQFALAETSQGQHSARSMSMPATSV